jgi:transcriptional antiterminator RfaH
MQDRPAPEPNHVPVAELFWYCLRSQPKHERIAALQLRKLAGVEVFAPLIRFERPSARGRGKTWVTEAMFPSYLFARFELAAQARQVQHSPGIPGIVQFGGEFPIIPADLVAQLQDSLGDSQIASIPTVPEPGQEVTITAGAFERVRALVTSYHPARERVRVLLSFLGREMEAELPVAAVVGRDPRRPLD